MKYAVAFCVLSLAVGVLAVGNKTPVVQSQAGASGALAGGGKLPKGGAGALGALAGGGGAGARAGAAGAATAATVPDPKCWTAESNGCAADILGDFYSPPGNKQALKGDKVRRMIPRGGIQKEGCKAYKSTGAKGCTLCRSFMSSDVSGTAQQRGAWWTFKSADLLYKNTLADKERYWADYQICPAWNDLGKNTCCDVAAGTIVYVGKGRKFKQPCPALPTDGQYDAGTPTDIPAIPAGKEALEQVWIANEGAWKEGFTKQITQCKNAVWPGKPACGPKGCAFLFTELYSKVNSHPLAPQNGQTHAEWAAAFLEIASQDGLELTREKEDALKCCGASPNDNEVYNRGYAAGMKALQQAIAQSKTTNALTPPANPLAATQPLIPTDPLVR